MMSAVEVESPSAVAAPQAHCVRSAFMTWPDEVPGSPPRADLGGSENGLLGIGGYRGPTLFKNKCAHKER
jgi:hypothetical protein